MSVVVEDRQEAGVRRNQCERRPAQDGGGSNNSWQRRRCMNVCATVSVDRWMGVRKSACGGCPGVQGEGAAGGLSSCGGRTRVRTAACCGSRDG